MVNRHIKNLILYKLVVVEGRLLREQHERKIHFFRALAKKISWSRARGKRPWNGNQFRIRKKSSFFLEKKMMIFVLSQPLSLFILKYVLPIFDTSAPIALMELYK